MGRLKGRGLPNRLGVPRSRMSGGAARSEGERDKQRDAVQPWRAWYKTARWQRLRRVVLARDGYVCQQTGAALVGRYPAANSPVIDHKKPHRGDPDLFWDESNLQSVSKAYHDKDKQRAEKRGLV
jgi:5-methylcytosine-specific restriction enzyme A